MDAITSKVELFISCRNLANMDLITKSDPLVALYVQDKNQWKEFGRTEHIKDNLNPNFTKSFVIDYYFEETQTLRFGVYDIDNASTYSLADDDFIGQVECTLGEIVGARGQVLHRPIMNRNRKTGTMIIRAEEVAANNDTVALQFAGAKLAKKDFLGKSDPYLVISKQNEDGTFTVVHKTEVIKQNLNPVWRPFNIPISKLCSNDHHRPLLIECYDWDQNFLGTVSADFIGKCQTTLQQLLSQPTLTLVDPKKNNKQTGQLIVKQAAVVKEYSLLEYIAGGCEISMIVSVDFTGSNGNPTSPSSLHYIGNPGQMNQYEAAIRGVGEILAAYDADKMFPAYGFGAKMPTGEVSHCFALNGNPRNPECFGIEGILQAYHQALRNVSLFGPTLFAPTIQMAAHFASQHVSQNSQRYFILLIITDGIITDMDNTIDAIVNASSLPLSIIIVGVGNEDFKAMEVLDSDDRLLRSSRGKVAERDIVQFVPYRQYLNKHYSRLAADTLKELPGQFLSYMKKHGIVPNHKVQFQGTPPVSPAAMPSASTMLGVGAGQQQQQQQPMPITQQQQQQQQSMMDPALAQVQFQIAAPPLAPGMTMMRQGSSSPQAQQQQYQPHPQLQQSHESFHEPIMMAPYQQQQGGQFYPQQNLQSHGGSFYYQPQPQQQQPQQSQQQQWGQPQPMWGQPPPGMQPQLQQQPPLPLQQQQQQQLQHHQSLYYGR